MDRTPFPKYEPCPCGSGAKYKFCCFTKGFHFYVDEGSGEVLRSVPLNGEARSVLDPALAQQREKFIAKFGREPGPVHGARAITLAPAPGVLGASSPVAASGIGRQRSASPVALADGSVAVAWEDSDPTKLSFPWQTQ